MTPRRLLLALIALLLLPGCSAGSSEGRPLRHDLWEAAGCGLLPTPVQLPDASQARIEPMEAPGATLGSSPYLVPFHGYLINDLALALLEGEAKAAGVQLQEAEARRKISCSALQISEEARERQKAVAEQQASRLQWLQIGTGAMAVLAVASATLAVVK